MRLRIFTEPQQGASYNELLAVARSTEELGFDGFFRSDHYLKMGPGSGLPGPTDAWTTLAGLARETSTIRLGTLMTAATFRWPGPLAITVAQVDAMSGGRIELGIGTGWFEQEHLAYGIPFGASFGERFERLEEQLEILRGMWTAPSNQSFSFHGKHYRVEDSPALPKPVQRRHPPLIVGGWGRKKTPRIAAKYADEFNVPFPNLEAFRTAVSRVTEACESSDREPASMTFSAALVACCGSTEAEFRRRARAIGREPTELRENGLAGSPQEVVDKLGAFGEAGAERIYLQVLDTRDLEHLELLAEEVLTAAP